MLRDKSADYRLALNRQIATKENRLEELNQERQRYTRQIENYQENMDRLYRQEEEFYYQVEQSGRSLGWNALAWREVRRAVFHTSERQIEQAGQDYRMETYRLQEEIKQVQSERNDLPWD